MVKSIVITGASGFLGQHLLNHLISTTDYEIHALHHSKPELQDAIARQQAAQEPSRVAVTVASIDLTSEETIQKWVSTAFGTNQVDCCIHTAAMSSPAKCAADPDRARAINVPRYLAKHLPAKRWIALSTDQVYDGLTKEAYKETDNIVEPCCNNYGQTKLEMERLFLQDHLNAVVLRSSIMLGADSPFCPSHSTFLDFIASITSPTTFFDNEVRNVIAVEDVCRICSALVDHSATGIYNMGGMVPLSRYDMAVAVLNHLKRDSSLAVATAKPLPSTSPLDLSMDSSKLSLLLPDIGDTMRGLPEMVEQTFGHASS